MTATKQAQDRRRPAAIRRSEPFCHCVSELLSLYAARLVDAAPPVLQGGACCCCCAARRRAAGLVRCVWRPVSNNGRRGRELQTRACDARRALAPHDARTAPSQ